MGGRRPEAWTLTDPLADPSILYWSRLRGTSDAPERIEVLERTTKSTVCRLVGLEAGRRTVIAKRCRAATGILEKLVYEEILPRAAMPSLAFHGMIEEPDGAYGWVFLADAVGETYSPADAEHRALAARWLAALHALPLET